MIDIVLDGVKIEQGNRRCGDCQLCCRLLPVVELRKGDNQRCEHQRHGKGCAIYERRPFSCKAWYCMWLAGGPYAQPLARPDRSHYVIDMATDQIGVRDNATGDMTAMVCLQIWVDPAHRDAHRDPALRAYISKREMPAIIRYGAFGGIVLFPPEVAGDGQWHEMESECVTRQQMDTVAALAEGHGE